MAFCLGKKKKKKKIFNRRRQVKNLNNMVSGSDNVDLGVCAVIGGYGFLGYFLALHLSERGYKVRILDIADRPRTFDKSLLSPDDPMYSLGNQELIEPIRCDITNPDDLRRGLNGICTIFHTCAVTDTRKYPNYKVLYGVNLEAVKSILELINTDPTLCTTVRRFIYTGSIAALLENDKHISLATEELERIDTVNYSYHCNNYGKSKAMAELEIEKYIKKGVKSMNKDLSYVILRVTCLCGKFDPMFGDSTMQAYDTIWQLRTFRFRTLSANLRDDLSNLNGKYAGKDCVYETNGSYRCQMTHNYVENVAMTQIAVARKLAMKESEKFKNELFHLFGDLSMNRWDFLRYVCLGENKNQTELQIPHWIFVMIAMIIDIIQLLVCALFGRYLLPPALNLGKYSIDMCNFDRTVDDQKLRRVLKVDRNSGKTEFDDIRLYTPQEVEKAMKEWVNSVEAQHKARD